jgi:hypothetical protein
MFTASCISFVIVSKTFVSAAIPPSSTPYSMDGEKVSTSIFFYKIKPKKS